MNYLDENQAAQWVNRFVNATNQHIFLTGKAGTGKTTLLKEIINTTHKKALIAAPTGIAAINAGGSTLHSLFHLPFGTFIPSNTIPPHLNIQSQLTTPASLIKNLHMNKNKRALLQEIELLIIDEVSMLRADLLDAIDMVLRFVRRSRDAFGGLQLLFIGDLWQLPPVVKDDERIILNAFYPNVFFFNAKALGSNPPVYIELSTIYRQTDQHFIDLLNHFRVNEVTPADIALLNKYCNPQFKLMEHSGYIYLTTHNYKADAVNRKALEMLDGELHNFNATVEGDFSEHTYPVDFTLELKKNAQVMFIKNDYSGENAYYNGKIGKVAEMTGKSIKVEFDDGSKAAWVEPYTWEQKKFSLNKETREIEETVVGKFIHFPLKLAWAITIHKSQGLTFEKAMLDISQAFAPGQIYVALSRLTSLKGLVLARPLASEGPDMDDALYQFVRKQKAEAELEQLLLSSAQSYLQSKVFDSFNFSRLLMSLQEHIAGYTKDENKSAKQKHLSWAINLRNSLSPLIEVGIKFQSQLQRIIRQGENTYLTKLYERVEAARIYFQPAFNKLLHEIEAQKELVKSDRGTKKYLTELQWLEGEFFEHLVAIGKAEALCLSALNNTQLNKDSVKQLTGNLGATLADNRKTVEKAPKQNKEKVDTRVATYDLYKQGLSVDEIAAKRSLTTATIEKHLADCIEKGLIEVDDLLKTTQLNIILNAIQSTDNQQISSVKLMLGDNASYTEIRYALAYLNYEQSLNDD
jgi:predicted transcriptional regulator